MDKRKILIGVLLLIALLVGCDTAERPATLPTLLDMLRDPSALTVDGAVAIALYADRLADSIEDMYPEPPRTVMEAKGFLFEAGPYAVYERILPEFTILKIGNERNKLPTLEVLSDMQMRHYGGDNSFHLMGTAGCWDMAAPMLDINVRFYNPASPLFDRADSQISVLVHELLHMQGICTNSGQGQEFNEDVESATQLGVIEVLAAMTRHRNKYTLLPFLREVQDFAEDFVLFYALEQKDLDIYRDRIVRMVANDSYRLASFEKSMNHWLSTYALQFRLKEIIKRYGLRPYEYLVEALNNEDYETRELPFPNRDNTILLNDAAYVLEFIEELVADYHLII